MHDWVNGTKDGEFVTVGHYSDGTHYGVPKGLSFGFPCVSVDGEYKIVDDLEINAGTRGGIEENIAALTEEYDAVKAMGFIK